jgi:hypothetical protein
MLLLNAKKFKDLMYEAFKILNKRLFKDSEKLSSTTIGVVERTWTVQAIKVVLLIIYIIIVLLSYK